MVECGEKKKLHLLNGTQIHLSMKVENQPQQMKEYSINLHLLLKGLHKEFPEKDLKTLKYWSLSNEATDSGSWEWKKKQKKEKKKKTKTECVWRKCCIMYVWYHFVLLIWIIDMILAKCFLNNGIIYYCLCYLSVSQTWTKKIPPPYFFFFFFLDSWWVIGLFAFEPPYEETCNVSWTKMKKQNMILSLNSIRTSALLELMWIASLVKNITIQG